MTYQYKRSGSDIWNGLIGSRTRIIFLISGWVIALLATSTNPKAAFYIPFFPFGLTYGIAEIFFPETPCPDFSKWMMIAPYIVYIALSVGIVLRGKRVWFYILFTIIVILLIVNVEGCHGFLNKWSPGYNEN